MSTITVASAGTLCPTPVPYRHGDSRRKSATPQATVTSPNQPVKPAGNTPLMKSVVPLVKTKCTTGPKTFSTPIQETEGKGLKPVDFNEVATAARTAAGDIVASPRPLCDNPHYHLSSHAQEVLNKIIKSTETTGRVMKFHGVDALDFEGLEHALGETGRSIKPRLTYDYNEHVLFVNMPSAIHEAPFQHMKDAFACSIAALPYDHDTLCPLVQMNERLEIEGKSVTPDFCISVTPVERPAKFVYVPVFGELACSEDKDHAVNKLKTTIASYPEAKMVILGFVREATPYNSPEDGSRASKTLRKRVKPLPRHEFITKYFPPCTSIKIAGHNWCHLRTVEYFVWLQGPDGVIDFESEDPEYMAHGTILPEICMDDVTRIFNRGVGMIRDSLVTFSKKFNPSVDCTQLEEAVPKFQIFWKDCWSAVNNSTDITAYQRYKTWHTAIHRGTKRTRDASYMPSDAERVDGSSAEASTSLSRGRPRRKRASVSLPPADRSVWTRKRRQ